MTEHFETVFTRLVGKDFPVVSEAMEIAINCGEDGSEFRGKHSAIEPGR